MCYAAGHNVVLLHTESRRQTLLPLSPDTLAVTALSLSKSRRWLAVAEQGPERASIGIWDLATKRRKGKPLVTSETTTTRIVSVAWHADEEWLLAQGAAPDWKLLLWRNPTSKAAVVFSDKVHGGTGVSGGAVGGDAAAAGPAALASGGTGGSTGTLQCLFHPGGSDAVTVCGPGVHKALRLAVENREGVLKTAGYGAMLKGAAESTARGLLAHCWIVPDGPGDGAMDGAGAGGLSEGLGGGGVALGNKVGDADGSGEGAGRSADRLLLGTETGEIILIDASSWDVVRVLQGPENYTSHCLAPYSSGRCFLVGGQAGGSGSGGGASLSFWGATENAREPFRLLRHLVIPGEAGCIRGVSVSPGDDVAVLTTTTGQIYQVDLVHSESSGPDDAVSLVRPLASAYHSGPITGLSFAVRRPLLATCSPDRGDATVRIWNHLTLTCEVSERFEDVPPLSVSLHPTGQLIAVGYADRLRLQAVLLDGFKTVSEWALAGCREVCFSPGGDLIAAADPSSHAIRIWSTYTGEARGELLRHTAPVWAIHWSPDAQRLASADGGGQVVEWDVATGKAVRVHQTRGVYYSAVAFDGPGPDARLLVAGSDRGVKVLGPVGEVMMHRHDGEEFSQLLVAASGQALLGATDGGAVRALSLPFESVEGAAAGEKAISSPPTARAHGMVPGAAFCAVPRIALAPAGDDGQSLTLATVGADGALVIFDAPGFGGGCGAGPGGSAVTGGKEGDGPVARLPWAEEVLVTRTTLDTRRAALASLAARSQEDQRRAARELQALEARADAEAARLSARFQEEIVKDEAAYRRLEAERAEMEGAYEDRNRDTGAQQSREIAALEASCEQKVREEAARYQRLVEEMELMKERYEESDTFLHEAHRKRLAELAAEYTARLTAEQEEAERLEAEKKQIAVEGEERWAAAEEDADQELIALASAHREALSREREAAVDLAGRHTAMGQTKEALEREVDRLRRALQSLFAKERQRYAQLAAHEKDRDTLRKELRERGETISEKERRLYDLRKKHQELGKFRWMLDHKARDLREAVEPREAEISAMRTQVREMDLELERYQKQHVALELKARELRQRGRALVLECEAQQGRVGKANEVLRRFQRDVHATVGSLGDPRLLKAKVRDLFHRYADLTLPGSTEDDDAAGAKGPTEGGGRTEGEGGEPARQRDYLERTVGSLTVKLGRDADKARQDRTRMAAEHAALLQEINDLRREIRGQEHALRLGAEAAAAGTTAAVSTAIAEHVPSIVAVRREVSLAEAALRQVEAELASRRQAVATARATMGPARPSSSIRLPSLPPAAQCPAPEVAVAVASAEPAASTSGASAADSEVKAAITIQAAARGRAARREAERLWAEREEQERAAVKIQAVARGRADRARVAELRAVVDGAAVLGDPADDVAAISAEAGAADDEMK